MSYQNIAIAGATGNLGPTVVHGLVDAGFNVTVLSASGKTVGLPESIKVAKVDYSSKDSLISALKGQDAFISAIPKHDSQPALIDAAIEAGVKRFLPSEFGSNIAGNANTASLPVFQGKKLTQEYLQQKSGEISYTVITNGLFLDWGLNVGAWINLKDGPSRIYDGGNDKHSTTSLSDVAKAIVGVLKHPEETHNRNVYVQSAALSQNELIEIAQKAKPGLEIKREDVKAQEVLEGSRKQLEQGEIGSAMLGFIMVSAFGNSKEYGNLWDEKNDNKLFGIKELAPSDIESLIAGL